MAIDFSITSSITSSGRKTFNALRINSTESKFNIGNKTSLMGVLDKTPQQAINLTSNSTNTQQKY